jgi:hypothetical protein
MLQTPRGAPWALTISSDCLRFIGRYRRLEGFEIDAALLFHGGVRQG